MAIDLDRFLQKGSKKVVQQITRTKCRRYAYKLCERLRDVIYCVAVNDTTEIRPGGVIGVYVRRLGVTAAWCCS